MSFWVTCTFFTWKNHKLNIAVYFYHKLTNIYFTYLKLLTKYLLSSIFFLLQSKHPHVLYEYKDNSPQGCAVTDNYSGGYERGKRTILEDLAKLVPTMDEEGICSVLFKNCFSFFFQIYFLSLHIEKALTKFFRESELDPYFTNIFFCVVLYILLFVLEKITREI